MANGKKRILSLDEIIDGAAESASDVARRVCEDIRGDILRLSRDLNIQGSAADREKVEKQVKLRIARMGQRLASTMDIALEQAAQKAIEQSGGVTRYSDRYVRDILKLVQEQQGENLAAVYSRKMAQSIIEGLRKATVSTIQEAAVSGLTLREQKNLIRDKWEESVKGLGEAAFVDSGGHEWEARDYFTMNVRTNTMRVYNDVLAGNITGDGNDLAQISRHGDPHCKLCFPWEGRIVSITGKTKGFPTYEDARNAGCFHPNCTHTLQTVNEIVDAEEIELQRGKESPDSGKDPMKVAFELDVARKRESGMGKDEAEASVRRDRLEAAVRTGIPLEGSTKIVRSLTDSQVAALTDGVRVPRFSLARKHEKAGFNEGPAGGRIVVPREKFSEETLFNIPKVVSALNGPAGGAKKRPPVKSRAERA